MQATISWQGKKLAILTIDSKLAVEMMEKGKIGDGKAFENFLKGICANEFFELFGKQKFETLDEARKQELLDELDISITV